MRRGIPQPLKTTVVQMREDRRDCPATAFLTRRLRAPRTRVQMRQDELVARVVARVGFEQRVANLRKRRRRRGALQGLAFGCIGSTCQGSPANVPNLN